MMCDFTNSPGFLRINLQKVGSQEFGVGIILGVTFNIQKVCQTKPKNQVIFVITDANAHQKIHPCHHEC